MMPTSLSRFDADSDWWEKLGLRGDASKPTGPYEHRLARAAHDVLRAHPPTAFASGDGAAPLSLEDVVALVDAAAAEAKREHESEWERDAEEQRRIGWEKIEGSLAGSDADDRISIGRWAGISRGEAIAWCWNLFQYEPHGFVHPGTEVRARALNSLRAGDIPEVFGYPERARELKARGVLPREYRRYREALGSKIAPVPLAPTDE